MFKRNRAHIGSAVAMIPDHSLKLFTRYKLSPTFHNCYFRGNFVYENTFSFREILVNSKSNSVKLNPTNFTFIGSSMQITGKPDSNASLYIHPVSPRHSFVEVEVELHHCPPGFKLNNHSECVCNAHAQFGLFKCFRVH